MYGINSNTFRVYWIGNIDFVSEQTMALVINPLSRGESKVLVDKRQVFAGKQVSYIPIKFSAGRHLIEVEFNNYWHSAHFRASLIPDRYIYTASQIATELSREVFDDVGLLYAAAYKSGNDDFSIDIELLPLSKPTVLFLSSYEAVKWRLKDMPEAKNVKAVILSGYEIGSDILLPDGMDAVIYTLGPRYFEYEFQPKCECTGITWRCVSKGPSEIVSSLEKITGKKVVGLSGSHNPHRLVVPWVTFDSVSGYVEFLKDGELEARHQQCYGIGSGVIGRN